MDDLLLGLREAIDRATVATLSPHVGIVGGLSEGLRTMFLHAARPPYLVGDPAFVQRLIERDHALRPADIRDLAEPLDLAIVVGPPPASVPGWLVDARMRFVVLTHREELAAWLDSRDEHLDYHWHFVLEDHWRALVGDTTERSSAGSNSDLNGDQDE